MNDDSRLLNRPTKKKGLFKGLTKEEISWVWFDWANQSYVMIVGTVILSLYFMSTTTTALEATGLSPTEASAQATSFWAFANSVSTIVIGVSAPVIGTLCGYRGMKKFLFNIFAIIGIVGTVGLALVPPHLWFGILVVFVIAAIGFSGGQKILDSFLVDVSVNKNMNRVSTLSFGMGYIGGALAFIGAIALVLLVEFEILNIHLYTAYRISFAWAGLWWLIFGTPMFKNVHQVYGVDKEPKFIRKSFVRVWTTIKDIKATKGVFVFLIAFFLYSDGVSSIIRMATVYGEDIGLSAMTLLMVLLVTQFVAMPFAILYGRMADKIGARKMIYFGIFTYIVICLIALFMNPERDLGTLTFMFWALAMLVGTAQGGIQALSRSYFGQLVPKEKSNEFFGIYNIFGRFASIIGTTLFGVVAMATGQPHFGIAVIAVLFIAAAIIFKFVPKTVY